MRVQFNSFRLNTIVVAFSLLAIISAILEAGLVSQSQSLTAQSGGGIQGLSTRSIHDLIRQSGVPVSTLGGRVMGAGFDRS